MKNITLFYIFINDKFNPYAVIWDDNNKQYVRNDANYDPRRIIKILIIIFVRKNGING